MLEDLAAHILDIAENSVRAKATEVLISLVEDLKENRFVIEVQDNGCGLDEEAKKKVTDPFYTTKKTRRVGLGLPFLEQMAKQCGGSMEIHSMPGKGTTIRVSFEHNHVDRPPLGDMGTSLMVLVSGYPNIRWIYRHRVDEREFEFDSEKVVEILGDPELLRTPDVALWIRNHVSEELEVIASGGVKGAQDHQS